MAYKFKQYGHGLKYWENIKDGIMVYGLIVCQNHSCF